MKRYGFTIISLLILASLTLSGCMTLASDVTPPPNAPRATEPAALPTAADTQVPDSANDSSPAPTVQAQDGSVAVEILDQSGSGLLESGLTISLVGYDQMDQVYQDSLDVPADGQVVFSDVPFESGRVFFASVPYGGAIYRSEIVQVDQETSLNLQVEVYETTTDDAHLLIDRLHILLDFSQDGLIDVTEIFICSNLGSKTIVSPGPDQASADFPLPENAGSIQFDDGALGQGYVLTENGFGDTISIPPGSGVYQVLVYYTLPYQGSRLDFKQVMNYPLDAAVVMIPADSATLTGSNLEDLGVQTLPSASVQAYSVQSIAKGDALEFKVKRSTPGVTSGMSGGTQALIIGAGVLGILMLGAGVWLFFKNRKDGGEVSTEEPAGPSQEEILDSILALEDLYKQGEISKKSYQSKRAQLKEQLGKAARGDK